MSKPMIILLYKDKSFKAIKEKDFRKYFNSKELKCVLFPKLDNPTVYYPIIPDKRLLSSSFHVELTFDISEFDLDRNGIYFKDRFNSSFDTQSVIEFIEYLSIFYKNNGSSALLESACLEDGNGIMRAIYPTHYKIDFEYGMESIDSGVLNNATSDIEIEDPIYQWLVEDRMYYLSDILFTTESDKNSSFKLPNFLILKENTWTKNKYIHNSDELDLDDNDLVLIRMDSFHSYYLLPWDIASQIMHVDSFDMDLILCESEMLPSNVYDSFAANVSNIHQVERDALCRYLIAEEYCEFKYTFTLGDIYCFLAWLTFSKDIINYLTSMYKVDSYNPLILIRHLGNFVNTTFTFDEIQHNNFAKHLQHYITRRMK